MRLKYILSLSLVLFAVVLSGCTGTQTTPTMQTPTPTPTPTATITSTPMPTITPTPTPSSAQNALSLYTAPSNTTYIRTSSSKIYTGELNGKNVEFVGKVFNVLPRETLTGTKKQVIPFQVWGNMLSYDEPIFVAVLSENVNGTVRDGVRVRVKGVVSEEWFEGTNAYGGPTLQPLIYGHEVEVIPEKID